MATISLKNSTFTLHGFTRTTSFDENRMVSYANCNMNYSLSTNLQELAEDPLTSITIKNNENETIYSLENIDAHIRTIEETLNGEYMSVNLNIHFD